MVERFTVIRAIDLKLGELLMRACAEFPGRVFGSVDVRGGRVAIKGWVETSQLPAREVVSRFQQAGVAALIVTDVSRDGTQGGSNIALFSELAGTSHTPV